VLEDDGTEVDEDVDVVELAGRTFILLAKGQCWSETLPVGATPASVPEPEPTKPPASEHSLSPEGTTSKTSQKQNICIYIYVCIVIILLIIITDNLNK